MQKLPTENWAQENIITQWYSEIKDAIRTLKNLLSKIELHSLRCWSIITGHESPSKRHEEVKTKLENLAQRALPECRAKRWSNVNCKSWARIWEDGLLAMLQNQSHGRGGGSREQREQGQKWWETSRAGDGLPECWTVSTVSCWWTRLNSKNKEGILNFSKGRRRVSRLQRDWHQTSQQL